MYKRKTIFWSACAGMLLFGISIITLGSVATDLIGKLSLSEIEAGTLFSILPFGILAGSLVFGPLVDRYGYKFLLAGSALILFAGFEGIALSASIGPVRFFTFLIGFGGGAINGATNALVADISEDNKGADLSLLGMFFGIGALGMPLLLGLLSDTFSFETIIASVGIITLGAGIFFLLPVFPPPKQSQGFPIRDTTRLLRDRFILLVAAFLFFQSSLEGIINNWTTSWITDRLGVEENLALYALSSYVGGMTVMRLLTGTVFRSVPEKSLLLYSYVLMLAGLLLRLTGTSYILAILGLFLLGAGLASGFPVMLGFTGTRFASLSGTAFSLVLSIALVGNMSVNYAMGFIAGKYGIKHLTTVAFIEMAALATLAFIIIKNINRPEK